MAWLEQIRNKPRKERIRLLWIIILAAAVLLVLFWIAIGNYHPGVKKDTSLFQTISKGIKDLTNQKFK